MAAFVWPTLKLEIFHWVSVRHGLTEWMHRIRFRRSVKKIRKKHCTSTCCICIELQSIFCFETKNCPRSHFAWSIQLNAHLVVSSNFNWCIDSTSIQIAPIWVRSILMSKIFPECPKCFKWKWLRNINGPFEMVGLRNKIQFDSEATQISTLLLETFNH